MGEGKRMDRAVGQTDRNRFIFIPLFDTRIIDINFFFN